jgi:hypothetical protein
LKKIQNRIKKLKSSRSKNTRKECREHSSSYPKKSSCSFEVLQNAVPLDVHLAAVGVGCAHDDGDGSGLTKKKRRRGGVVVMIAVMMMMMMSNTQVLKQAKQSNQKA